MALRAIGLAVGLISLLAGCATVGPSLDPAWLQAETGPGLAEVKQDIAAAKGRDVLWGGQIVRSINKQEGTLLEILQQPLDRRGRPESSDRSAGRFLVLYPGYLETLIYGQGRQVTVFGPVSGSRTLSLQEIDYTYPLITTADIHLWETEPEVLRIEHTYPYGDPYLYSPYWRWRSW